MVSIPEILVIGGGPAGSAAARLLSQWGHQVRIITRPAADSATLAESVPPSCGKLFDLLGVRGAIDGAGFVRHSGNTVWWGASDARAEPFVSGEHGWQVTAAVLERVLLTAATQSGAIVEYRRCDANDVRRSTGSIVLDCTGRAGLIAKARGLRMFEPTLRTVALVGAWERPDASYGPDPTHTWIESYEDGWVWSVPVSMSRRQVAVMVDPRKSNLARGRPSTDVYLAEIAKTREIAALFRDAQLIEGPSGWDASMYGATAYTSGDVLLVGDSGSFIDPLSSIGIKKALASAWLAAVVAHTSLITPSMRETAYAFFDAREKEIYASFRALTARHFATAASAHAHPFWSDRVTVQPGSRSDEWSADALRQDPAVRKAFAQLRESHTLNVQRAPDIRVELRPAVNGIEIVHEPRLMVEGWPEGVRFLHDVDVVALLNLAPTSRQVPELFESYCTSSGPVDLAVFLLVLSTAVAKQWVLIRDP